MEINEEKTIKQADIEQKEQEPRCQECHRLMYEATTYFFPSHTPVRIDVPYFYCPTDRRAQLNIEKLKALNPKITDETIDDIKKYLKKELHFKLQE